MGFFSGFFLHKNSLFVSRETKTRLSKPKRLSFYFLKPLDPHAFLQTGKQDHKKRGWYLITHNPPLPIVSRETIGSLFETKHDKTKVQKRVSTKKPNPHRRCLYTLTKVVMYVIIKNQPKHPGVKPL